MLVSIVIPTYNAAEFINTTLQSILAQTYSKFEVLVVDDHSSDKTVEIITQCRDPRVKLIRLDANAGGPAKPRNVGLLNASGDVVAFCDADDLWHRDKLYIQIKVLRDSEYEVVCTDRYNFTDASDVNTETNIGAWSAEELKKSDLHFINPICLSSVVAYRRVFDAHLFNEDQKFVAVEDYLLWLQIVDIYCICKVRAPLALYRIHSSSISRNKLKQILKVWKVYQYKFGSLKSVYHVVGFCLFQSVRIMRNVLS